MSAIGVGHSDNGLQYLIYTLVPGAETFEFNSASLRRYCENYIDKVIVHIASECRFRDSKRSSFLAYIRVSSSGFTSASGTAESLAIYQLEGAMVPGFGTVACAVIAEAFLRLACKARPVYPLPAFNLHCSWV